MYVSGEGIVREVVENPFSLEYNPRFFAQSHRFIDFKVYILAATMKCSNYLFWYLTISDLSFDVFLL